MVRPCSTTVTTKKALSQVRVEIHLSNIFSREEFRKHSYISPIAVGVITGFGPTGYGLALNALLEHLEP